MRIVMTVIVLVLAGTGLAANLFIADQRLSPGQLQAVTAVCSSCHGSVPAYEAAIRVHNVHVAFRCVTCHSSNATVVTAADVHQGLKWAGLGIALFALVGGTIAMVLTNRNTGRLKGATADRSTLP